MFLFVVNAGVSYFTGHLVSAIHISAQTSHTVLVTVFHCQPIWIDLNLKKDYAIYTASFVKIILHVCDINISKHRSSDIIKIIAVVYCKS